jgi:pimeloyl-ACP methyl ester carboxylesterase
MQRHQMRCRRCIAIGLGATAASLAVVLAAGSWIGNASAAITQSTAPSTASTATPTVAAATTVAATTTTPSAVGIIKLTLVDPTRSTAARGDTAATSSRTLTVTIRYPAIGTASTTDIASATPASGSFPLVVLVHGYNASADTYSAMEHDLAAAGFVVAAPDFPLSSSAVDGAAVRDAVDQAADVSFVIHTLTTAATAPTRLAGVIAQSKVGVIGHSDGGITAAGIAYNADYADSDIGAAVALSGAETAFPGSWFTGTAPSLLAIHGTADEINPYASSQQLYGDATGTKYLVDVLGGSHLGPFTTDPVQSQISTLVADFLRAELQGNTTAANRIASDANIAGALSLAGQA